METDVILMILSQVVTVSALGGVLWQRQASTEQHTDDRFERLRTQVEGHFEAVQVSIEALRDQVRRQNSRLNELEAWKAERRGFQEGYGRAKERYANGDEAEKGT